MADNIQPIGYKLCSNHLKENIEFMCEDCKEKICITCASTTHKGHSLIGIKLLVKEKYNRLQDLAKEVQETKIPKIKENLHHAEETVKDIQKGIHSQIEKVIDNGKELKALIDKSTASNVSELKEYEKEVTQKLDKFIAESESAIKEWEDFLKESADAAKSDNNVLIIDVENNLSARTVKEPEFKLNYIPVQFVKESTREFFLIGELGKLVYEATQTTGMRISTNPSIDKFVGLHMEPMSIHKSGKRSYFISEYKSANLIIVGTNGSQKKLAVDTPMTDFCIDPVTNQLYCVPLNKSNISSVDVSTGETTKLFDTKRDSFCIQVANSGKHFIVGAYGEPLITLYNVEGN